MLCYVKEVPPHSLSIKKEGVLMSYLTSTGPTSFSTASPVFPFHFMDNSAVIKGALLILVCLVKLVSEQ